MTSDPEQFTRTHDLTVLDSLLRSVLSDWHWPTNELRLLSQAAVVFRYPGESAGQEEANAALNISTKMKEQLLARLNSVIE